MEKSVKELTSETEEVGRSERRNSELKRNRLDGRSYKAMFFKKQLNKVKASDDTEKHARENMFSQGDSNNCRGDGINKCVERRLGELGDNGGTTENADDELEIIPENCSEVEKAKEPELVDSPFSGRITDVRGLKSDHDVIPTNRKRIRLHLSPPSYSPHSFDVADVPFVGEVANLPSSQGCTFITATELVMNPPLVLNQFVLQPLTSSSNQPIGGSGMHFPNSRTSVAFESQTVEPALSYQSDDEAMVSEPTMQVHLSPPSYSPRSFNAADVPFVGKVTNLPSSEGCTFITATELVLNPPLVLNQSVLQPSTSSSNQPVGASRMHFPNLRTSVAFESQTVEPALSYQSDDEAMVSEPAMQVHLSPPSYSPRSFNAGDVPFVGKVTNLPSSEGCTFITATELVLNPPLMLNQSVLQPSAASSNQPIGASGMHFPNLKTSVAFESQTVEHALSYQSDDEAMVFEPAMQVHLSPPSYSPRSFNAAEGK